MGKLKVIQITKVKHGPKVQLEEAVFIENFGIDGDSKGGGGNRQISMLKLSDVNTIESIGDKGLCTKKFSSNLVVEDMDDIKVSIGDILRIGSSDCQVVSVGKKCYEACPIRQASGPCKVSKMGIFLKVVQAGVVKVGDSVVVVDGGE